MGPPGKRHELGAGDTVGDPPAVGDGDEIVFAVQNEGWDRDVVHDIGHVDVPHQVVELLGHRPAPARAFPQRPEPPLQRPVHCLGKE